MPARAERGHMVAAPRAWPSRPGASRLAGREGRRSLPPPPAPPPQPCQSPVLPFLLRRLPGLPSLFSFFLPFRFLFSNCVPGCSLGGAPAAEQLADSGRDGRRCRLLLLVPEKLRSVLGELGAWRGPPPTPGLGIAWGCWEKQGTPKSALEAATVPAGGIRAGSSCTFPLPSLRGSPASLAC